MTTRNAMCNSLTMLVVCAGMAVSSVALAQNTGKMPTDVRQVPDTTKPQDRDANRRDVTRDANRDRSANSMGDTRNQHRVRGPMAYFDDVTGATVRGSNGESVGTVEDVIFDRHSGEIAAYVVNAQGLNWGNDSRLLFPNEIRAMTTDDGTVAFNVSVANPEVLRSRLAFNADAFKEDGTLNPNTSTWWNSFSNESDRNYNRADYYNEIYKDMNKTIDNDNRNRDNTDRNRDNTTDRNRDNTTDRNRDNTTDRNRDNTTDRNRTTDGTRTGDQMQPIPGTDGSRDVNPQTGANSGTRTGVGPDMDSNYMTWPYGRETYRQGAKPMQMRGTVSSTERMYGDDNSNYTILVLRDDQGKEQRIILGPSWYLADQKSMPMRGDNVNVTAVEIEPIERTNYAASSMEIQGRNRVDLRKGEKNQPAWHTGTGTTNTDARRRSLLLASTVVGDDVRSRTDTSGKVSNLVLDLGSGRVLALVIDPNENFLGIADTTRMIPVSVVSPSSDDTIDVDATKEMILNAPEAPDRLDANMNWDLDRAYNQNPVGNYSTSADR
jgi:sporulation protein YlmC with PRC-barrel domain